MKKDHRYLIILHILLAIYSLTGVASKFAAREEFLSRGFILYYGLVLFGLFVYAFVWQQLIKHMPLITAYANKGATVIWGIVWGYLIFSEEITVRKLIGAAVIIVGIILIVTADFKDKPEGADDSKKEVDNGQ
ncbi:MAG: EamA family transporter [Lachnospiraceae bacterium]|nr:EamA family transporter [Lachnospiraceae bacterium]